MQNISSMTTYVPAKGATPEQIETCVDAVLREATLVEKVTMMSGQGVFAAFNKPGARWGSEPYRAGGGLDRLGVPALWFTDGPRGVARGNSTCFPCSMARGASFDADLELRIGEAMGIEVRAQACNLSGAVCINLLRHPAWGRAQETYGEDPHHLGVMGSALSRGLQTHNVIATVKHFALNSMENARFTVDVRIDERALHEVYLPHFKAVIDAGCKSVMSAYNRMNGEYCGQNRYLLTDILRGEWGFPGFVHSDWVMGVYQPYGAAAGLDIENPEPTVFGKKLVDAVNAGHIEPSVIDTACRRILRTLYTAGAAEDPLPAYPESLVANEQHLALALEAAEKSAVLLKNDSVLPFAKGTRLAVLGRLARLINTGDNGSSRVQARHVVTALEGLSQITEVTTADEQNPDDVRNATADADAIVVVVGLTAEEEGEYIPETVALGQDRTIQPADGSASFAVPKRPSRNRAIGGDRDDLGLPSDQIALIEVAVASGKPLVVVIVGGSAILVEKWHDEAGAILQTFYAGQAGGTALARLLFGDVAPSGRLPFTVAKDAADYPFFDIDAASITYDLWHGYAKFDRDGVTPRYPFGHGLSYTSFDLRALKANVIGDKVDVSVAITNTGRVFSETPLLMFVTPPGQAVERWPRYLKGFTRVALAPGQTKIVRTNVAISELAYRDTDTHGWRIEPGEYGLSVMTAAHAPSIATNFNL
jgi:beta-glucosidase